MNKRQIWRDVKRYVRYGWSNLRQGVHSLRHIFVGDFYHRGTSLKETVEKSGRVRRYVECECGRVFYSDFSTREVREFKQLVTAHYKDKVGRNFSP